MGKQRIMKDCLFCKIERGEVPGERVYEDEHLFAINDIAPKASTHVLVIPRKHIESLNSAQEEDSELLSHIMLTIPKIAKQLGLDDGYRIILNTGSGGGQVIFHIHFHLLAGELIPFG